MSVANSAATPTDAREEISRLEERIETLAESIERCRKLALVSRLALIGGAAWVVAMLVGLIPIGSANIAGAIAALLGGTVLLGSNSSTWAQTAAALATAEARRNELIGIIDLRTVGGNSRLT